jgi:5-methylcytosine-specific restriction endonuclease McrA
MPRMRVCSGCGTLIPAGTKSSGYKCRDCANRIQRAKRARRGSTTERGLGAQHQRLARQVLAEEPTCWLCGEPARVDDPLEVDHVIPRSEGGATTRANLRAAHRSCNRSRGGTGGGGSRRRGGAADPATSSSRKTLQWTPPRPRFSRNTLQNVSPEDEGPLIG